MTSPEGQIELFTGETKKEKAKRLLDEVGKRLAEKPQQSVHPPHSPERRPRDIKNAQAGEREE